MRARAGSPGACSLSLCELMDGKRTVGSVAHVSERLTTDACLPSQAPSNPMLVGNLFVMLDVVFPEEISPAMQAALKAHLPCPRPPPVADDECEHHTLVEMDPVQSFQATDIPDEHAADDEDEGHGGAQQVQCQQQ